MRFSFFVFGALLGATSAAHAHIALQSPAPRYADMKQGPCGRGSEDKRGNNVTTYEPGETITVEWKETIPHPGHYRIAFDPDGSDIFEDPKSFTDVSGGPGVLVDGIEDKSGTQTYTQQVTLPNVECDNCTLQLIQMMTDKPPYGNGDDLYYQCADIVLKRSAPDAGVVADAAAPPDAAVGGSSAPAAGGDGCQIVRCDTRPWSLAVVAVGALILSARRRRSI